MASRLKSKSRYQPIEFNLDYAKSKKVNDVAKAISKIILNPQLKLGAIKEQLSISLMRNLNVSIRYNFIFRFHHLPYKQWHQRNR